MKVKKLHLDEGYSNKVFEVISDTISKLAQSELSPNGPSTPQGLISNIKRAVDISAKNLGLSESLSEDNHLIKLRDNLYDMIYEELYEAIVNHILANLTQSSDSGELDQNETKEIVDRINLVIKDIFADSGMYPFKDSAVEEDFDLDSISDEDVPQFLGRLKSDADYYLGNGNKNSKHLWSGDPESHINDMNKLYARLDRKPDWTVNDYAHKMGVK